MCWLKKRIINVGLIKFNKSADQYHKFRERTMDLECNLCKLSVSDSGKVMVLKGNYTKDYHFVDLYETDGQFVCSFGEQNLKSPRDISTVSDGRVMVVDQTPSHCVHIFSELGDHLSKFDLKGFVHFPNIAFHRESQQIFLASTVDEPHADSIQRRFMVGSWNFFKFLAFSSNYL